ncbi:hypothetical protein HPB47_022951 [Ixodes persulcatus]|uniref:Uncharacterized protein n=1 Tax=Ixodes persulcatus TaxID=34615 RepID=A0AC60Q918_IXOPE|nr:hypothetical protein HPB47_022951 [Ixodes persulcatus]
MRKRATRRDDSPSASPLRRSALARLQYTDSLRRSLGGHLGEPVAKWIRTTTTTRASLSRVPAAARTPEDEEDGGAERRLRAPGGSVERARCGSDGTVVSVR